MRSLFLSFVLGSSILLTGAMDAQAFCGFYVSKADTKLFNKSSKVVIARDGERTVVTMASDYEGDAKEFAIVVPVPEVLEKEQIHVSENQIIDHLDAYTAPRLVEYFDSDPCQPVIYKSMRAMPMMQEGMVMADGAANSAKAFGVTIEEQYTVGEYDILILSAKQSDGLQKWLNQSGYKIPKEAKKVLGSYIKQDMKFFVAKVNLEEKERLGVSYLRPIAMAFESEKFMLPIRLGTVNSKGAQDMFIFTLTKRGQVETTNYRTVKIPSNMDVPLYVKQDFDQFYPAMFETAVKKENNKAVFLEYAWDMGWCDPCAADPLSPDELRELGVSWIDPAPQPRPISMGRPSSKQVLRSAPQKMIAPVPPRPQNVFVTRLHVRYDAKNFPEDLKFQETGNRSNYQGRYVLRHPFKGEANCDAGQRYFSELPKRFEKEAQTLSNLTGWEVKDIRKKMAENGQSFEKPKAQKSKWWKNLWDK